MVCTGDHDQFRDGGGDLLFSEPRENSAEDIRLFRLHHWHARASGGDAGGSERESRCDRSPPRPAGGTVVAAGRPLPGRLRFLALARNARHLQSFFLGALVWCFLSLVLVEAE